MKHRLQQSITKVAKDKSKTIQWESERYRNSNSLLFITMGMALVPYLLSIMSKLIFLEIFVKIAILHGKGPLCLTSAYKRSRLLIFTGKNEFISAKNQVIPLGGESSDPRS